MEYILLPNDLNGHPNGWLKKQTCWPDIKKTELCKLCSAWQKCSSLLLLLTSHNYVRLSPVWWCACCSQSMNGYTDWLLPGHPFMILAAASWKHNYNYWSPILYNTQHWQHLHVIIWACQCVHYKGFIIFMRAYIQYTFVLYTLTCHFYSDMSAPKHGILLRLGVARKYTQMWQTFFAE